MRVLGNIDIEEGGEIQNLTVASGSSFPANPNTAEVFYLTSGNVGLHIYRDSGWKHIASQVMVMETIDGSSGNGTHVVPAASSLDGLMYCIKRTDSSGYKTTVSVSGGGTLDSYTTFDMYGEEALLLRSDNSEWHII